MNDSVQEGPRDQHNHGPGTFIGGDNYGLVRNELIDPKTKTTLAKLSEDAPALSNLLRKALHDGVISPEAVAALQTAVRNINMDVADALMLAGRNINSEVADALMFAGQNINEGVANKIIQVKEDLSDTTRELDRVLDSLRETVGQVSGLQRESDLGYQFGSASGVPGAAQRTARVVTRPSPGGADNWKFRFKLIFWSFVVGFLAGVIVYSLVKH